VNQRREIFPNSFTLFFSLYLSYCKENHKLTHQSQKQQVGNSLNKKRKIRPVTMMFILSPMSNLSHVSFSQFLKSFSVFFCFCFFSDQSFSERLYDVFDNITGGMCGLFSGEIF